jgi:hypothetical protein
VSAFLRLRGLAAAKGGDQASNRFAGRMAVGLPVVEAGADFGEPSCRCVEVGCADVVSEPL